MGRLRDRAQRLAEATRSSLLGVLLAALLLGAVSARDGSGTAGRLTGLLVVGLLLHLAVYLTNDVADRKIDRTDPRRSTFPIVTGALPVTAAAMLAALALLLGLLLDHLVFGAELDRLAALYSACLALLGYDLMGKRCRWPVLTDLLQGLGGAAIVVYGAQAVGTTSPATWLTAGYAVTYLMLVNGVHGGVRDVENDRRHRARTVAVLAGVRQGPHGMILPPGLRRYATTLQTVLVCLSAMPLLLISREPAAPVGWLVAAAMAPAVAVASAIVLRRALRPGLTVAAMRLLGAAQLVLAYLPAVAMAGARHGVVMVLAGMAVMAVPLLGNPWYRRGLLLAATGRRGRLRLGGDG